jgi:hypothetical protein
VWSAKKDLPQTPFSLTQNSVPLSGKRARGRTMPFVNWAMF